MKTSDPYAEAYAKAARATERCQYHTPIARQCACLIQDPQSKFCPRHSESPSTDTLNFADLLAMLAYIASLLRTLPAIDKQLNEPIQYEIDVPPHDHFPSTEPDEPWMPEDDDPHAACLRGTLLRPDTLHNSQSLNL